MQRLHIIISGRVQGVGFRYQSKMIADKLHITGSVKNLANGNVEIYAQANSEKINKFLNKLDEIRFARIDNKNIEKLSIRENENDFQILY